MLVAALALAGCKKEAPPSQEISAPPAVDPASGQGPKRASGKAPALPPPPSYVSANAQNQPLENVAGEVNAFLTQQLHIFIQQQNRMPQSFAEFASVRLDSMPRPPEGMKWVIDAATKQVKAAPAK